MHELGRDRSVRPAIILTSVVWRLTRSRPVRYSFLIFSKSVYGVCCDWTVLQLAYCLLYLLHSLRTISTNRSTTRLGFVCYSMCRHIHWTSVKCRRHPTKVFICKNEKSWFRTNEISSQSRMDREFCNPSHCVRPSRSLAPGRIHNHIKWHKTSQLYGCLHLSTSWSKSRLSRNKEEKNRQSPPDRRYLANNVWLIYAYMHADMHT